jgi:hypothetical protein
MTKQTSDQLDVGRVYTRENLRELFDITDATSNNGIFHPKGTSSVWLFVTEEKAPDRVQYVDHLDGDALLMQGQTEGRTDHYIINHARIGLELLLFHRMSTREHEGAGFRYHGPFEYIRSFGHRPKSFVLMRADESSRRYGVQAWRWALDAVRHHGGRASLDQVRSYISENVPDYNPRNAAADLRMLSVNEYGRGNWSQNKIARRTDGWIPYDALFRVGPKGRPFYELYDPSPLGHGVWELVADSSGVMRPSRLDVPPAVEHAQKRLDAQDEFDASDEQDGRKKVLMSIARRLGQPKFRRELLDAYGHRCAVTGCPVLEILEGAHIKPYRGRHTNHVTNGLLLRADIHTLFDLKLLRLSPATLVVEVAERARASYGDLHGRSLRRPLREAQMPDAEALRQHYESCVDGF